MSLLSSRRGRIALVALVAAAGVLPLALPRDVLVSPAVTVEVVDKRGSPVSGVPITRSSAHYSVERTSTGEDLVTDASGRAAFAPRRVRISRGAEWVSAARKMARNVDTGLGPRSWVIVALPGAEPTGVSLFPEPSRGELSSWRCVVAEGCTLVR